MCFLLRQGETVLPENLTQRPLLLGNPPQVLDNDLKGLYRHGFKCYRIRNQTESFHIHPSVSVALVTDHSNKSTLQFRPFYDSVNIKDHSNEKTFMK